MNCKAKTHGGQPCKAKPIKGSKYCFIHDPASGEARAKARKLGGQRQRTPHAGNPETLPKQIKTIEDVKGLLDYTLAEIIPLENSIQRGRLLVALAGEYVNAIKTGEIESRLAAIEAALKQRIIKK